MPLTPAVTTIRPALSSAAAFVELTVAVIDKPPVPKDESSDPSGKRRARAMYFVGFVPVVPANTILPSLCRARPQSRSSAPKLTIARPPAPNEVSILPSAW